MTTWSMTQVSRARGIRATARLDAQMVERARTDVLTATRRELFHKMQDIAETFAIDLNPGDVQFREELDSDQSRQQVQVRAWWEPETTVVEFRGGERDGDILAVQDAPYRPVQVPRMPAINWLAPPTEPTEVAFEADVYECVGWHEQDRHWVYEAR